jgi:hypothetical protein
MVKDEALSGGFATIKCPFSDCTCWQSRPTRAFSNLGTYSEACPVLEWVQRMHDLPASLTRKTMGWLYWAAACMS